MKCFNFMEYNKYRYLLCLAWILSVMPMFAQNMSVKGYVYDKITGEPLIGATVLQKGTQNGVVTDVDGNFVLALPVNGTLVVNYIGYESKEVKVTSAVKKLKIAMEENSLVLDEVVAIGYGSAKKKDLTGSIASVRLEDSPRMTLPNMNVLDALKGQLPGFDIGTVTNAGGNPSINIRGQNSIKASNDPLLVVDGVVFVGSWNELNPNDIASVDVLKDASSAAVYGSRAANGVILVTTKRGKSGKPTVRFGATVGFQTPTVKPDMLSPEGYLRLKKDLNISNGASDADLTLENMLTPYEYSAYQEGNSIDWYDECVDMGLSQDYQVSVSGGTEKTNYYISGQYLDQKGVMYNDKFKKFSVTSKVESQVTDWLKIGLNLSVISKNADGVAPDMRNAINNTPYGYKYVRFEGFENQMERSPQGHTTTINPLWQTTQFNEDRNQNYRSSAFARVELPWVKGLSYTFNYSLNRWEGHSANFQDERYFMNTLDEGDLYDQTKYLVDANGYKNHSTRTDWFLNHLINYNRTFGDHTVTALVLYNQQKEYYPKLYSDIPHGYVGLVGRVTYDWKSRYMAEFNVGYNGSENFASDLRFSYFPAGSIGWVMSEEKFFRPLKSVVSFLKLRASVGLVGNDNIGGSRFMYMADPYNVGLGDLANRVTASGGATNAWGYGFGTDNGTVSLGAREVAKNNPAVTWEKALKRNYGVDINFLDDRLKTTFEYYKERRNDILLRDGTAPGMLGFITPYSNLGSVDSWGWELSLKWNDKIGDNFRYWAGINLSYNQNEILEKKEAPQNNLYQYQKGHRIGSRSQYVFWRFYDEDTPALYEQTFNRPFPTHESILQNGDAVYVDLNGDRKIDANDASYDYGFTDDPEYMLGINLGFSWKNLEISTQWTGAWNVSRMISDVFRQPFYSSSNSEQGGLLAYHLDHTWTPENPSQSSEYPRATIDNAKNNYATSTLYEKDAKYLRLKTLQVAYNFHFPLMKKLGLNTCQLAFAGYNLWTITPYLWGDPEARATNAPSYPLSKTYTLSLKLGF